MQAKIVMKVMRFFKKKKNNTILDINEAMRPLLNILPGYRGYANVKDRAKSDLKFREKLVGELDIIINDFTKIAKYELQHNLVDVWGLTNEVNRKLRQIKKIATKPDYGRSTFFENPTIQGYIDDTVLYVLEYEILNSIEDIKTQIKLTEERFQQEDLMNINEEIKKIMNITNEMIKMFEDRMKLISIFEISGVIQE